MDYTLKLEVPEGVYEPLAKAAEQAGRTPEELAREWLVTAIRAGIEDPVEDFIGALRGNIPDWADEHDEYIGQTLVEQMKNMGNKCS
ncbi:hypothetical protein FJY63_03695 [Candidatus Sumerlaeota bacterium]|nr:hypothetical protein [Candidatus Sumerlaeota bacterium]